MKLGIKIERVPLAGIVALAIALIALPGAVHGQSSTADNEVTFSRDIAPILQQSCQNCHRPGGVAPMALVTYEQVRPWAQMIKFKTGIRDRAGAMPPWYVEKDIGIQHYKYDPSLEDDLQQLIRNDIAGDPCSDDKWVRQTRRELQEALHAMGHAVSHTTVRELLKKRGFRCKRTANASPAPLTQTATDNSTTFKSKRKRF